MESIRELISEFSDKSFSMPMVALRGMVMFPDMNLHFDVGRTKSIRAVKTALENKSNIFLCAQTSLECEDPHIQDLYNMGVVCEIKQVIKSPNSDALRVIVGGLYRAKLLSVTSSSPFLSAIITRVESKKVPKEDKLYEEALIRRINSCFEEYGSFSPQLPPDIIIGSSVRKEAGELSDFILSNIPLDFEIKQSMLDELDPIKRTEKLYAVLNKEIKLLGLEDEINQKVQDQMDENQREYYLREQIKVISDELGEGENLTAEIDEYKQKITELEFSEKIQEKLMKECERLRKVQSNSPEAFVIRNYLDKVLGLPWKTETEDNYDIAKVREYLEKDHYGLSDVKQRIIEYIAVRKINPDVKGQIICLAGAPGVGKTSIAKSLAGALGRKYARISLGGVRDEADIRGHRKTYIGAMPGRIIEALDNAGSHNPLILLDEVDKLGSDFRGDPSSALLEVLDGEQNFSFVDHYIEIPYDLSKVLFVTTANDKNNIPEPLLDRMDVIDIPGYTYEDKFNIAKKHLIPKQLKENGLKKTYVKITDKALKDIITGYTKEAGVRNLEREIAKICRKVAVKYAEGFDGKLSIKPDDLKEYLGSVKFKPDEISREDQVGVVNGLAYTSVGGAMLKVETALVPGKGSMELTGSLGDVIKESAKAAITCARSNADKYGFDANFIKDRDMHIHFPEGAVPKDGPSAGVTVYTSLVSALSGRKVRSDVAMTGEITITGRVLPIGGLREKTMAAYVEGIKTVIIPYDNESDLDEVDAKVKENINFILAKNVDDVINNALIG